MDKKLRRRVAAEYRDRDVYPGIFALHCVSAGKTWIGKAPDISKIENRLRFSLNSGVILQTDLKAALAAHGADSFRFEELERLKPDLSPLARDQELKSAQARWASRLGAGTI
ncbi:MAG: GIY-YIG nuclease family protein [Hyphomicrobiaceae bacterium]|nr:GIY-YIG nuclease family protein [Hyphomicrobiaceae bacterium]